MTRRADPDVVDLLASLLDAARKGQLTGLAYVGFHHDGNTSMVSVGAAAREVDRTIGRLMFLIHKLSDKTLQTWTEQ